MKSSTNSTVCELLQISACRNMRQIARISYSLNLNIINAPINTKQQKKAKGIFDFTTGYNW